MERSAFEELRLDGVEPGRFLAQEAPGVARERRALVAARVGALAERLADGLEMLSRALLSAVALGSAPVIWMPSGRVSSSSFTYAGLSVCGGKRATNAAIGSRACAHAASARRTARPEAQYPALTATETEASTNTA